MKGRMRINLKSCLVVPLLLSLCLIFIRWQFGVLLFHTLAELFSIIVGILMLIIVWNTRRFTQNDFLVYLGIGYFWVAVLDTWHTFTVKGIPFFDITDAEITLHFWVYTRLFEALLLLSAPLFLKRKLNAHLIFFSGGVLALLISWASFSLREPVMLTPQGLTTFKVAAELLVIALLCLAVIIYIRLRGLLAQEVLYFLLASLALTISAELSFTLYTNFYGVPFMVGHLFKFLSFWMIFQAIVRTTLNEPFSVLAQASSTYDAIPHPAVVVDNQGVISQVNRAAEESSGMTRQQLLHHPVHPLFHPTQVSEENCVLCRAIRHGTPMEGHVVTFPEKEKWFLVSLAPINVGDRNSGMVQLSTEITERIHAQHAMQESEQNLNQLLNTMPSGIQKNDLQGVITYSNTSHHRILGCKPHELIGRNIWDNQTDEKSKEELREYFAYLVAEQPEPELFVTTNLTRDGRKVTLEIVWDYLRDTDGKLTGFISVISDITEFKLAEAQARQGKLVLDSVFQSLPDLFFLMNPDCTILDYRAQQSSDLYVPAEVFLGKRMQDVLPAPQARQFEENVAIVEEHGGVATYDYTLEVPHGLRQFEARLSQLPDTRQFICVVRDVTERKQAEQQILHQAHFDSLTDLPNRFLSLDRLSQLIGEAQRDNELVAVLFLDLDDFKKINDTLGHDIGDKLLIEAAERLRRKVRDSDTVGRLGGDEFIVLLGGLTNPAEASPIVKGLLNCFRDAFRIDGRELVLTVSVGISIYPDDGINPTELLRSADSAMYHSKGQGRNIYSYFTEAMNQEVSRRLDLEEQMHGALERGEFELSYQTQVKVSNREVLGFEALLKWSNPALGNISPTEFIPVAEQSGMIIPIGQFVLTEALAMLASWQQKYGQSFTMAVNLSPWQFRDPNLLAATAEAIAQSGVPAATVELEITEGVLLSGDAYIGHALAALSELGVLIAMDDFGTGYSSLNYLRKYPFNILKIDRSFIQDITTNSADLELVNATIAMAHGLDLKVVAEGVETEEQMAMLATLGCDYAQGYLFSKPVGPEQIAEMLEK